MRIDWSPLRDALANLRRDRIELPIWWRDDDAIAPTRALDRLGTLSERLAVPVHLAVIPKDATPDLAGNLSDRDHLMPVVHGWAHQSHAGPGQKNSEFGTPRASAAANIADAAARMRALFGTSFAPLFVPPWNRLHDSHLTTLSHAGFLGVSTFKPRPSAFASEGLKQINTHIDPIDWRGTRDLVDPDALVTHIAQTLEDRRRGATDALEPLGLLTHHLVHSESIWQASEHILLELLEGGAKVQSILPRLDDQT